MNPTKKAPSAQVELADSAATMVAATEPPRAPIKLLNRDQVLDLIGVSYASLWGWIRDGKFPAGRSIGFGKKGHVAWIESEVMDCIKSRPVRLPKGSKQRAA